MDSFQVQYPSIFSLLIFIRIFLKIFLSLILSFKPAFEQSYFDDLNSIWKNNKYSNATILRQSLPNLAIHIYLHMKFLILLVLLCLHHQLGCSHVYHQLFYMPPIDFLLETMVFHYILQKAFLRFHTNQPTSHPYFQHKLHIRQMYRGMMFFHIIHDWFYLRGLLHFRAFYLGSWRSVIEIHLC